LQHMGFFGIFEARLDFGPAIPLFWAILNKYFNIGLFECLASFGGKISQNPCILSPFSDIFLIHIAYFGLTTKRISRQRLLKSDTNPVSIEKN
jgi:hypothetical protein